MMMKYVGAPAYIPGVPGRDLTMEEWNALPQSLRDLAHIFYVRAPDVPARGQLPEPDAPDAQPLRSD